MPEMPKCCDDHVPTMTYYCWDYCLTHAMMLAKYLQLGMLLDILRIAEYPGASG